MKMFSNFLLFILSFCPIAFSEETPKIYKNYIYEIVDQFSLEIENEFNVFFGLSTGEITNDIEKVRIRFTAFRRASLEEARKFEVIAIEKFISMINHHEKIRPFLREYPFPMTRVEISITYVNKEDKERCSSYTDNSLSHAYSQGEDIYYFAEEQSGRAIQVAKESYDEAVNLVYKEVSIANGF